MERRVGGVMVSVLHRVVQVVCVKSRLLCIFVFSEYSKHVLFIVELLLQLYFILLFVVLHTHIAN